MRTGDLPDVVIVTGTDTGVGKTITTAALTAALRSAPWGARTVSVYKPVQTGVPFDTPGDVEEVARLTGLGAVEAGVRLDAPMAPVAAARLAGVELPSISEHAARVAALRRDCDVVLVEGAGGVLVDLDARGSDLTHLAASLDMRTAFVVVCRSGLGTLNHTLLTLEALERRDLTLAGLVIGSWPARPTSVDTTNKDYLSKLAVPLAGAVPAGASALEPRRFCAEAPHWFTSGWPARCSGSLQPDC